MDALTPLLESLTNPYAFLPLLFIYSVMVAVVLPTPVEVALLPLMAQPAMYGIAALVIGAGKAMGSWLIFLLGLRVDPLMERLSAKLTVVKRFIDLCIRFVARTKYVGLFLLLALPFMSDTVPLYVYSLFNHQGEVLHAGYFIFTNFLAGVNRALIMLIALTALGLNLLL